MCLIFGRFWRSPGCGVFLMGLVFLCFCMLAGFEGLGVCFSLFVGSGFWAVFVFRFLCVGARFIVVFDVSRVLLLFVCFVGGVRFGVKLFL